MHSASHENALTDSAIAGCLLGTAVGDAIGLPYEGLSRRRAKRLLGPPNRHRLVLGRGMVSDDTELTCLVAQSLIASNGNYQDFEQELSRRLRWWLLMLPAGIGFATLRSILKLWIGFSPRTSGVYSAGNGPAMRSAILGAAHDDLATLQNHVAIATRITHQDPKAEYAAHAVALAAYVARQTKDPAGMYIEVTARHLNAGAAELSDSIHLASESALRREPTTEFSRQLGLDRGVTGYSYHTVPVAIHAWLLHPQDFRSAVIGAIECGGDTDTTAAIVGGIVGAGVGETGIPNEWRQGIWEWPRSVTWMRQLANRLEQSRTRAEIVDSTEVNSLAVLGRNLVFLAIVLYHGFRRLLPPY